MERFELRSLAYYCLWFALGYCVLLVVYRVFLHPLSRYRGPSLAKLTDAYGGYGALVGNTHLVVYRNHVKYGSVVRHGPGRLVFNTVTALNDIYNNPLVTKSEVYCLSRHSQTSSVWDTIREDEHRRKRKVISQPISEKAMRGFEPIMLEQLHIWIEKLRAVSRQVKPVNMSEEMEYLAGDIIGHLAFGFDLKTQTEATNKWLFPAMTYANLRANTYMMFPRLAWLDPLVRTLGRSRRRKYQAILLRMIKSRMAMPKDAKNDFYAYAADKIEVGSDPGKGELWSEAFFFVGAGGGTVTTVMSALFFYLSRYPECYKKLSEEIRSTFTSGDQIRAGSQLQECKYLRACINETMRISPPAPGMLWRRQVSSLSGASPDHAEAPFIVDGHVIPRGTEVAVNIYALHHNEDYFPNPFTFKPERWLAPEANDPKSLMRRAFSPFSIGPRACAGKALAYLETSLTVAQTLFYFDFEKAPGQQGQIGGGQKGRADGRGFENEFQLRELFVATHKGPILVFEERKSAAMS